MPSPKRSELPQSMRLRILATSDLHANLVGHDYFADRPGTGGLARAASLIRRLRDSAPQTLLFDTGDLLQGGPLADHAAQDRSQWPGGVHPVIAAMNLLDYDAITLGNHDFNYGLPMLRDALAGARFDVVLSNLRPAPGTAPLPGVVTRLILTRTLTDRAGRPHKLRIGVLGLTPPQVLQWDRHHLEGLLEAQDMLDAARAGLADLRRDGADIVLALAHTGFGGADPVPRMENAALPLSRIAGIDAVLAGHQHRVFPSPVKPGSTGPDAAHDWPDTAPLVMPGFGGSHLGLVDLDLSPGPKGWQITAARAETRPVTAPPAADICRLAAPVHAATRARFDCVIGRTEVPLHSYFSAIAPGPAQCLVAAAQLECARTHLAGSAHAGLPLLSATAPFKAGGLGGPENFTDVPPGPLRRRHIADIYVYPNMLRCVRITVARLRDWLEHAAGIFDRLTPGLQDQPLIDTRFPFFNFDTVFGVTYSIDLAQPPRFDAEGRTVSTQARRIGPICWQGQPLPPGQEVVVVTNSHRTAGTGGITGDLGRAVVLALPLSHRDIVTACCARGVSSLPRDQVWHFAPMPGTGAVFRTGPQARAHVAEMADHDLTDLGQDAEGYLRYRLAL